MAKKCLGEKREEYVGGCGRWEGGRKEGKYIGVRKGGRRKQVGRKK